MDANEFWKHQTQKNESGAPKYSVTTDVGTPEEEFMAAWIVKWHQQFNYFDNSGCGCCVNIYEFDAPEDAVAEIPVELVSSID